MVANDCKENQISELVNETLGRAQNGITPKTDDLCEAKTSDNSTLHGPAIVFVAL